LAEHTYGFVVADEHAKPATVEKGPGEVGKVYPPKP
jgi:hypothetical protein